MYNRVISKHGLKGEEALKGDDGPKGEVSRGDVSQDKGDVPGGKHESSVEGEGEMGNKAGERRK